MKYNITNLKNNIRVASCSMDNVESVSIGIWVDIGARYENATNSGISHFLEHMVFKGTKTRTAKKIAEEIENVGGYMNAYTTNETTAFYVKVLKDDIALGFELLSDMLLNSIFTDIEKEKQVVLQEISQTYDNPADIVFDYFHSHCFCHQKLGQTVLGDPEVVKSITTDDLYKYLSNYFSNKKLIISAAGNCDHATLLNYVEKYFTRHIESRHDVIIPEKGFFNPDNFIEKRKELEQSQVLIGFEGVKREDEDYYHLLAFSSIFGGGMSSKLFQEIRENMGLAYSVYSFLSNYRDTGVFGIYVGTAHDKYKDAIETSLNELKTFDITDEEMLRAKNQMKASFLMADENPFSVAERMANQLFIVDRIKDRDEILQAINSVTKDDVMRMKEKLLASKISEVIITK